MLIIGASRGIGLAAARELTRRGAALTITARSDQRGQAAAGAIGGEVDVLIADLSSQESVRHLAAEVLARYPRLDVLINNAGAVNRTRRLTGDGRCGICSTAIPGLFEARPGSWGRRRVPIRIGTLERS